jgi:hypothetical protein
MFDFGLAPCNLAILHLGFSHYFCIEDGSIHKSKKARNIYIIIFLSTLKKNSQLECQVQKLIHNEFF